MANPRQLAHPPLREALIDIQLAEVLPLQSLESLEKLGLSGLVRKQQISFGKFEVKIGPPPHQAVNQSVENLGWRYESTDGSKVVQIRRNGITYSIVRDYRDWPEILGTTRLVWQQYLNTAGRAITVARVAVRYINVLEFPPVVELNDYLTSAPQIPAGLPQTLDNFFQRVVVPFQGNTRAIITQALEATSQPGTRVILDIDVFTEQLAVQGDSPDLWSLIDGFRTIKNAIFFSSVTESALERYA